MTGFDYESPLWRDRTVETMAAIIECLPYDTPPSEMAVRIYEGLGMKVRGGNTSASGYQTPTFTFERVGWSPDSREFVAACDHCGTPQRWRIVR